MPSGVIAPDATRFAAFIRPAVSNVGKRVLKGRIFRRLYPIVGNCRAGMAVFHCDISIFKYRRELQHEGESL